MSANEVSILAPSQCKAQKPKTVDCRHADHPALLAIHLEFQLPLKILPAGFKQPMRRAFTSGQYHDVVCMPDDWYASAAYLPVEFVQVDVG